MSTIVIGVDPGNKLAGISFWRCSEDREELIHSETVEIWRSVTTLTNKTHSLLLDALAERVRVLEAGHSRACIWRGSTDACELCRMRERDARSSDG